VQFYSPPFHIGREAWICFAGKKNKKKARLANRKPPPSFKPSLSSLRRVSRFKREGIREKNIIINFINKANNITPLFSYILFLILKIDYL